MRKKIASSDQALLQEHQLEVLSLDRRRQGAVLWHDAAKGSQAMKVGHRHRQWEINLVTRGWVRYLLERRQVHLTAGTLAWLLPRQPHRMVESSPDFQMWVVVFEPAVAKALARDADFALWRSWLRTGQPDHPAERVIDAASSRRLASLCDQLYRDPPGYHAEASGLTWLAADAWRAYQSSDNVPAGVHLHPAVEQAARMIHDHPALDDLDALAAACCVSRAHLSRLFRQHLGWSITDFRNRQRVDRFLALSAQRHRIKATQAAYAAGFGSYTQAFRVVREVTGKSPRDLQRDDR